MIRVYAVKNQYLGVTFLYNSFEQARRADAEYVSVLVFFGILNGKKPLEGENDQTLYIFGISLSSLFEWAILKARHLP